MTIDTKELGQLNLCESVYSVVNPPAFPSFSPLFCLISALIKSILIFYRKKMGNCDRL